MQTTKTLLVFTDIFGATAALRQSLNELQQQVAGLNVLIWQPDSCVALTQGFDNDQSAYDAFVASGGLASYVSQVVQQLAQQPVDLLLGFSAGAAAIWCALGQCASQHSDEAQTALIGRSGRALLCYGGQIRQHQDVQPAWPVTCIWSNESHFDVVGLQQALQQAMDPDQLQQQHWPYAHGFINPHSAGYDATAAAQFWQSCCEWVRGASFSAKPYTKKSSL